MITPAPYVTSISVFYVLAGLSKEEIRLAMARSEQETLQQPQHLVEHPEMMHQCCGSGQYCGVSN